ncbi:MAG: hypothetical protein H6P98_1639 [Candidatus Aminicenantes bacterium]|nr:hypothetical protein [Candidatus Aminicenantes bacterium]
MKAKGIIVPFILLAMGLSLVTGLSLAAQQKDKKQDKIFIPKEVSSLIQDGLASRQGRQDIPVNIFRTLYLPAKENFQAIFLMNIKNSALGFAPAAPAAPGTEAGKNGPQETAAQEAGETLQAGFNVFLQFNRLDDSGEPSVFREVYVPATIQVPAAGFDPEKEDLYSVGYPLPFGHYLLALAVTSLDLKSVGIAYHEFTIPDPSQFSKTLDTTPVFFVKQMDQMEAVEQRTVFHRGMFTYSVLKVVPNIDNSFQLGENLDIFFYIFGAKPNSSQQYDIEINFEVKQGEQSSIKWSSQTYNSPLISQPLPMKQTVKIKKGDEPERIEQRDLPAGSYTLVISVLDKASQNSVVKTLDITVK